MRVAVLLSVTGGYLDAFTWLAHDQVLANAQTANVVLLGVYAALGEWTHALRHLPPILAFALGVLVADRLRARADNQGKRKVALMSLIVEIAMLIVVMILHLRLPSLAGTLGISFAAALQASSFARVRGSTYSSVMLTNNLRQVVQALLTAGEQRDPMALRRAGVFAAVCVTFGLGAAMGAHMTARFGSGALGVPVALLIVALTLCLLGTGKADRRHLFRRRSDRSLKRGR